MNTFIEEPKTEPDEVLPPQQIPPPPCPCRGRCAPAVVTVPRPPPAREAPRAILTRRGRRTWIVYVHQFPISYGECTVRGWTPAHARRRAARRGERLLAEYIARENPETVEIYPEEK